MKESCTHSRGQGKIKLKIWHGISVAVALWALCYALFLLPQPDFTGVHPEITRACQVRLTMRLMYLSVWNYVAYGFFAFFSLVEDFVPNRKLRLVLDWAFTTYVLPFSLLVSTVFWAAQSVSPYLLVPEPLLPMLTPFLNHTVHSSVAFGVMFELISRPVRFPGGPHRKTATARRHKLLLAWQIMAYLLYATTGVFMYPINGMFNWPLRLVLDLFMHSVLLAADFIPRVLAYWWWNPQKFIIFTNLPLQPAKDFVRDKKNKPTPFRCKIGQIDRR